jgi:uncharacterized protein YdeI (YjbR/CyaY-like superfamily)
LEASSVALEGEVVSERREPPVLPFASAGAWEAWLEENHGSSDGLWLKIAKKDAGIETVTHTEALDVALCYGWIDGQRARFDEEYFLQRFTPRRARSRWSKVNREKVAKLTEAGRMQAAGLRGVELARADGRWGAAYDSPSTATVPEDLKRKLTRTPGPRRSLPRSTAGTATRSSTAFRKPNVPRPARAASRRTCGCSKRG